MKNDCTAFKKIFTRECLQRFRNPSEWFTPLLFFIVVAITFPLATTPASKILQLIGPGVIWVAALLSTLLSLPRLFQEDHHDGSLSQLLLAPYPLSWLVLAKIFAHWVLFTFPLIVLSPLLAMMYHLSLQATFILWVGLLLGTPILSLIGAVGAAITVGLRQGVLLLALIILPSYIPVLIFGTQAVMAASQQRPVASALAILGALLALTLSVAPLVCAFSLRIGALFD